MLPGLLCCSEIVPVLKGLWFLSIRCLRFDKFFNDYIDSEGYKGHTTGVAIPKDKGFDWLPSIIVICNDFPICLLVGSSLVGWLLIVEIEAFAKHCFLRQELHKL